jgi:hypothetical protein
MSIHSASSVSCGGRQPKRQDLLRVRASSEKLLPGRKKLAIELKSHHRFAYKLKALARELKRMV